MTTSIQETYTYLPAPAGLHYRWADITKPEAERALWPSFPVLALRIVHTEFNPQGCDVEFYAGDEWRNTAFTDPAQMFTEFEFFYPKTGS